MRPGQLTWAMLGMFAVVSIGAGCEKSSERERRETERAIAEASKATTKADEQATKKTQRAEQRVAQQATEFLAAVSREKADATYDLHVALDKVDKQLAELDVEVKQDGTVSYDRGSKKAPEIERLVNRRDALRADLDLLETAAPHEWPALKSRIRRDIDNQSAKPTVAPPARRGPSVPPGQEPVPGT